MAYVQIEQFTCEGIVSYPCRECKCRRFLDIESIRYHLYKDGFKPDYWVWTKYKELLPPENQFGVGYIGSSSIGVHVANKEGGNVNWKDNFSRYQGMIFVAIDHEFGMYSEPSEEVPNPNDENFYSLLETVNMPL